MASQYHELKAGQYQAFTLRLPQHVPELKISLLATRGCVCLYASNCSERPLPRNCQWNLLVDATKEGENERTGTLTLQTAEVHFVSGIFHIGIYLSLIHI